MGGRKVCFIDDEGQVGTCVRDDENCLHCKSEYEHFGWLKDVRTEDDISAKVFMKASKDYHMEICKKVHILEQTVYGLRDLASALRRTGLEKIGDELDWRAGNIEDVITDINQILESLECENKIIIYCEMCKMPHMKQIMKILNE